MNILFLCGYLNNPADANNKIAKTMAKELSLLGHKITVAGILGESYRYKYSNLSADNSEYSYIGITRNTLVFSERDKLGKHIDGHTGIKKLIRFIGYFFKHPFSAVMGAYCYTPFFRPKDATVAMSEFLKDYTGKNNIDIVIAVTMPEFTMTALFNSDISCKKALYQLDPFYLHEFNNPKYIPYRKEFEYNCFKESCVVFTTDILKEKYSEIIDYSQFTDKIYAVDFPTLKAPVITENCPIQLPQNKTNIVFCGYIDDKIRNPHIFLSAVEKIISIDKNIAVHFVGNQDSRTLEDFVNRYPENIFRYSSIDNKYIPALLDSADYLLNIGNTLRLQVPSKIYEYFASCKPIIHQELIDGCSCHRYMQKYPLAFIMDSDFSDWEKLYEFICKNKDVYADWNNVQMLFSGNIPENAAKVISDAVIKHT